MQPMHSTSNAPFTLQELIGKYTLLSNAPRLTRSRKQAATTIRNALKQAMSIRVVAYYIETCVEEDRKLAQSFAPGVGYAARERLSIYEAFLHEIGFQREGRD